MINGYKSLNEERKIFKFRKIREKRNRIANKLDKYNE